MCGCIYCMCVLGLSGYLGQVLSVLIEFYPDHEIISGSEPVALTVVILWRTSKSIEQLFSYLYKHQILQYYILTHWVSITTMYVCVEVRKEVSSQRRS